MAKAITVKGLRDLEKALRALQKEYGGKSAQQALRPAVKASMQPLLSDVRANTPVDTGDLRDSTKLKIGKPTKKMVTQSQHYNNNTVIYGAVGWFWKKPSLWYQALAVEYGTQSTPAKHILKGAIEGDTSGMIKRFQDTLGPSIEKKAKQLAKKRGR